jgi:hypothetical protein
MGACGIMCAGGSSLCGTTCTNLSNDPNNCSACGKVCPGGANATAVCSASACSYVCTAGHADCNGLSADGCEATLATDDNNCGTCGNKCPGGWKCTGGACLAPLLTFTTCGQTGATGPAQAQCNTAYPVGNPLSGVVTVVAGVQQWTIPSTGTYRIQTFGAAGGNHITFGAGGKGAMMQGDFALTAGQVLQVLVGQKGMDGTTGYNNGAGGGSFVAIANAALIVASGGGTHGNCGAGTGGMDGSVAIGNGAGGASSNSGSWCGCGAEGSGGGGFTGNGAGNGGFAFLNGGAGATGQRTGQCIAVGFGGFGGGGNSGNGGGGGGGYQGGTAGGPDDGASANSAGQGGLSFDNGANQVTAAGVQTGDGLVNVTPM